MLSNNFYHRFIEQTVERVFNWILSEINRAGYLSPEAVFIDGTHINPGNIHDNVAIDGLYDRLCEMLPEMKYIVADVA